MKVQIYEIQTPEEAEKVIELGVQNVGSVILSDSSWKLPEIKETIKTVRNLGATSSLIPLYSGTDEVFRTIEYYSPDIIHFCEALFPFDNIEKTCSRFIKLQEMVRERFPEVRIMRSIPIPDQDDPSIIIPVLKIAELFEPYSDFFLTDTFVSGIGVSGCGNSHSEAQPVPGYVGITGKLGSRSIARDLVEKSAIPVILAGGLSPENVYELALEIRPYGVDSCTLTNAADSDGKPIRFKKDLHRVSAFVNEAKRAALKCNS